MLLTCTNCGTQTAGVDSSSEPKFCKNCGASLYGSYKLAISYLGNALALSNPAEAIPNLLEALKYFPDMACAYRLLGDQYYLLDRLEDALTCYQRVPEDDDDYIWCLTASGDIYGRLGRYDEAYSASKKATELNPTGADSWYTRAVCCGVYERYDEGIDCITRFFEVAPPDHQDRDLAASLLQELKEQKEETEVAINWPPPPGPLPNDVVYRQGIVTEITQGLIDPHGPGAKPTFSIMRAIGGAFFDDPGYEPLQPKTIISYEDDEYLYTTEWVGTTPVVFKDGLSP